jgi:hypothetical protein
LNSVHLTEGLDVAAHAHTWMNNFMERNAHTHTHTHTHTQSSWFFYWRWEEGGYIFLGVYCWFFQVLWLLYREQSLTFGFTEIIWVAWICIDAGFGLVRYQGSPIWHTKKL